jgi:uncharacterized protein YecE (DUF72 family)
LASGDDGDPLGAASSLAEQAPEPARSGTVASGTAGWTDKTLLKCGRFYPNEVKTAEQRLKHYARHFSMVEVDATYYALPAERTTRAWCDWTPPGFTFHIKAHPVFTGHPIDVKRLPKDVVEGLRPLKLEGRVYAERLPRDIVDEIESRFFSALEPLERAGRLGRVLLQFPPWLQATRGAARRLEQIRERWSAVRFATEFRHKSWLLEQRRARVFDLLSRLEMTYVCVDEPEGPVGGVPALSAVTTSDLAMVRFHGQNAAGWAKKGASVQERFDYLYTEKELASWVEPVKRLTGEAQRVHAVFNNCVQNYAVLNAKGLVVLLGRQPDREALGPEP